MENYLEHSKKGTSWAKKGAKYISRIKKNGKWVYTYKLRKAKDVVKKAAVNVKEDQEMRERIANQKARDKKTKKLRSKKYKAVNKVRGYVNTYKIRKHEKDMKKYSDSQVKKHKEMLHTMSNDYGYLIHSKGPWKDHKYTAKKTGKNGKPVYIYSEYKEGDKDFDYEGEEWEKNFKRVEDSDGFYKTNPDGTITLVEEDMKWTLPKGTKMTKETVDRLLDDWKTDSRRYKAKEYQKETEQYKKRELAARTATAADLSVAKRAKAVANAYKDQQDAAERRGRIIAEAYAEQKKKSKIKHGDSIDDYGYLIHSAKGSTWEKKNHKYKKKVKVNGIWKYVYTDKYDEATKHENGDKPGYVLDENGNRIHNSVTFDVRRGEWTDPTVGATRVKNSIESINNSAKKINESTGKVSRKISKSREQSARVNGNKNLAESKERKAREQEAARREKVTRENRERDARINSHKAEMKNTSEARQLKEELTKRGYGNDIKGDVSLEYLRALESNTKKNRW